MAKILKNYNKFSYSYKRLTIISNICKLDLELDNQTITQEYVGLLVGMAPRVKDVFEECYFMDRFFDCDYFFHETITEDGICFTFNVFDSRKMFHEDLYVNNNKYLIILIQICFI